MRAFLIQFTSEKDSGSHLEYFQKDLPQKQYTVISIISECKWYKCSSPIFPRHKRKKRK